MTKFTPLTAALVTASFLLACSSSGGGTGDGGTGGSSSGSDSGSGSGSSSGGTATTGVSLAVTSATSPATVGGIAPSAGSFLAVVDLTLKNTGASAPLSTNFVLFSLQTSGSLVISASPAQPSGACSPTVSVASGGQIDCAVAFDVPSGQTPTTLIYDDLRGDKATASVPSIPVASAGCTTVEGWLGKSPSNACFMCLVGAELVEDAGPCASAVAAYNASCDTCAHMCSFLSGSAATMCSCELGCDSASCQALFGTLMSCIDTTCSSSCP
jgi:hypothetical protein